MLEHDAVLFIQLIQVFFSRNRSEKVLFQFLSTSVLPQGGFQRAAQVAYLLI